VYDVNAATGKIVRKTTTGGAVLSSPDVANGFVYVGSNDGRVYDLDAATGKIVWKTTMRVCDVEAMSRIDVKGPLQIATAYVAAWGILRS
jgi:outer membrane protein assembly factor BamB